MTFHELNLLPEETRKQELLKFCGSSAWAARMSPLFPMEDLVALLEAAEQQWYACDQQERSEAFTSGGEQGRRSVDENAPEGAKASIPAGAPEEEQVKIIQSRIQQLLV